MDRPPDPTSPSLGPPTIRRRQATDVPLVVDLLLGQQPLTRYPFRDPLPMPAEEFVVRPGQIDAWVALDAGPLVGHVGTTSVADDAVGAVWADALGTPVAGLGAVTTLVVVPTRTGRGIGGALLQQAEDSLVAADLTPVLEVLGHQGPALSLYASHGWREVARAHPPWLPEDEEPVRFLALSR